MPMPKAVDKPQNKCKKTHGDWAGGERLKKQAITATHRADVTVKRATASYFFARGGKPVCCVNNWPFWGCPMRLGLEDKEIEDLAPAPVLFLRRALW